MLFVRLLPPLFFVGWVPCDLRNGLHMELPVWLGFLWPFLPMYRQLFGSNAVEQVHY